MMNIINASHSKSLIIVQTWAYSQVDSVEVSLFGCAAFALTFWINQLLYLSNCNILRIDK